MKGTIWCLHGAVGCAADWDGWRLDGWAIRRVDLWRFLSCCPMSLAEFGGALNREAEVSEGKHVLLGYSMGGRLGLHALAANGPWSAAIMISTHPGLEDSDERAARRAADAEWAALALRGEWAEFLRKWNAQPVLQSAADAMGSDSLRVADRHRLVARRQEIARSFIDWSLGAQSPLWGQLASWPVPTLWVAGEHDAKFSALAGRAADAMGAAAIAPHAGHRVPWENPDWLTARVRKFLSMSESDPQ